MRGVDLAALLPITRTHPSTPATPPRCPSLWRASDIESERRPDIPPAEDRHQPEDDDVANRKERRVVVLRLLRNRIGFVRPRKDVILPHEEREQQKDEGDRQERDVPLHEADHGARPPRRRYALYGDEDDSRLRHGGEEQPVEVERAPSTIGRHEDAG